MILRRLELTDYRNYRHAVLDFNRAGAYLHGPNGSGKTNVLEAVYLLSMFKSFRSNISNEHIINWSATQAIVYADFEDASGLHNEIVLQIDKKKNYAGLTGKR